MNSNTNSSVSACSLSVKKKISLSLKDSGTCTEVGSKILISSLSKIDLIISILSDLSNSVTSPFVEGGVVTTPDNFCRYASNASS